MRAKRIDPVKGSKKKSGETQPQAAERWKNESAAIRDEAIRSGRMTKDKASYAVTANVLGQDGPKMDTGKNVKGGSKAQMKASRKRVKSSGASPQAKRAAKKLY